MIATQALHQDLSHRPADGVRQRVVSADFHVCSCDSVVRWLEDAAPQAREETAGRYVSVANVTDVMDAHKDPAYATALSASDLTVPDGRPVVWALRSAGHPIRHNVRGADLMQRALETESIARRRHLLIGGSPEAREGVRQRFPDVNWVGEIDFSFNDLDDHGYEQLCQQFLDHDPDYAWVCLGGGKQVRFMHRFTPMIGQGVLIGVGAAFDFHAGMTPEAPRWMSNHGFEWLFRLSSEPRRLWRRYLIHNPPFLYHWGREALFRAAPDPVLDGQMGVAEAVDPIELGTDQSGATHRVDPPHELPFDSEPGRARPVSLVVPLYNEQECIAGLMDSLHRLELLLSDKYELEFVLVDDGSRDNTVQLIGEQIAGRPHYRLVRHAQNRGVAAAIFTGIREASCPTVASIDADGSYDLSILQGMLPMTSEATPLVTASPYHPLGGVEGASAWRIALSRGASRVYSFVMPQRLNCYTACFRTYHRPFALNCEPTNDGFTGVAELAWKVQRQGGQIGEYPAVLRTRQAGVSKMRVSRTALAHGQLMTRIAAATLRDALLGRKNKPPTAPAESPECVR